MKFGYTIVYVPDVKASVEFFERAFGLKTRFVHESGYAEMDTGETALAFASHQLGHGNLPDGYMKAVSVPCHWVWKLPSSHTMWQVLTQKPSMLAQRPSRNPCLSLGGRQCPMCVALTER